MNGSYTTAVTGADGSGFIILGTLSLFILPFFIVGWFYSSVREAVFSKDGKKVSDYIHRGTSIWMSLYIYGI
jgi:hypothetical protein